MNARSEWNNINTAQLNDFSPGEIEFGSVGSVVGMRLRLEFGSRKYALEAVEAAG